MSRVNIVILGGLLWGVMEATFGGVAHFFHLPFIGYFMAAVGFAVMFQFARHPKDAMAIATIAALLKLSDAFLFHLPLFAPHIANPVVAILLQGLVFSVVWAVSRESLPVLYPYLSFGLYIPIRILLLHGVPEYGLFYHIIAITITAGLCWGISKAVRPTLTIHRGFAYGSTLFLLLLAIVTKI